jgi:hypothetical protein
MLSRVRKSGKSMKFVDENLNLSVSGNMRGLIRAKVKAPKEETRTDWAMELKRSLLIAKGKNVIHTHCLSSDDLQRRKAARAPGRERNFRKLFRVENEGKRFPLHLPRDRTELSSTILRKPESINGVSHSDN